MFIGNVRCLQAILDACKALLDAYRHCWLIKCYC